MTIFLRSNWRYLLVLSILSFVLVFWQLGQTGLWQGDEGIYGSIAYEMSQSGDGITPMYNHAPRFDKPPLYFWLTAITFKFYGVSELTVRLWPALFGVASVFLVFFIGLRLWSQGAGLLAALVLLTSLQNTVQSRVAVMDSTLTFWLLLCIWFLISWYKSKDWKLFYWAMAASAIAALVKGPIALLFPTIVLLITLGIRKELQLLKDKRVFIGLGVFLLVSGPWYAMVTLVNGMSYLSEFFGYHNFERYTRLIEQHGSAWYYYIFSLMGGFFPWSAFLILPVAFTLKTKGIRGLNKLDFESLLFLVWVAFIFIFFSCSRSKLPGYIFPIYPILALVVGHALSCVFSKEAECSCLGELWKKGEISWVRVCLLLFVVLAEVFAFAMFYALKTVPPSEIPINPALLTPLVWILGAGAVLVLATIYKPKLSLFAIVLTMTVFMGYLVNAIVPVFESDKSINVIAKELKEILPAGAKVGEWSYVEPRAVFYLQHKVDLLLEQNELLEYTKQPDSYVVMTKTDYLDFTKKGITSLQLLILKGDYVVVR